MKELLKKLPRIRSWYRRPDNAHDRRGWVEKGIGFSQYTLHGISRCGH